MIVENKAKYRELCKTERDIAIFQQAWWLDATCGSDWDVALFEKGNKIFGALPYSCDKIKGLFTGLAMPRLTQFLGPWIKYPEGMKYERKLSFDKEVMFSLIDQLPSADSFAQNFSYNITNWLPFYWKGYDARPLYTYVIDDLSNLDELFNKTISKKLRRDINKASSEVVVEETEDLKRLYALVSMTFERQKRSVPYTYQFLDTLDKAIQMNAGRKIFLAYDKDRNVHAGAYIIWDDNSAYYLIGGEDTSKRQSQAMSLLIWEAIKFSASVTKKFDFEGSNIEPIEQFFKKYGAMQKVYYRVYKKEGKLYSILLDVKDIIKQLIM